VAEVTAGGHFERVAAVYDSLRTTDEAPVRRIGQFLPDRPVTGLDIGCGTGRYTRLLRALLPEGSLLAASDVSAAMLAQLKAGDCGHARGVVPLLAAAEQLPLRTASLDLVTAFNCVHHSCWSSPAEAATRWSPAAQAAWRARRSRIRPSRSAPGAPARLPRGVLAAARRSPRYAPSPSLATTFGTAPRSMPLCVK
jgi:SAM-dependent methyltransferase